MKVNADAILIDAIQCGLRDGIAKKIDGYNAPLGKIVDQAIERNADEMRRLLSEAIAGLIQDENFRETVKQGARNTLAKKLVQRFGGELEKQVNALKSDPTTRAKITLAIEEIVSKS